VARLPPQQQAHFANLLQAAGQTVDAGVVAANTRERKRYWKHWQVFVSPFADVDAMLSGVPDPERIELLTIFAERVRAGNYGNGATVRAGTVQVALHAIGKTFEMDGLPNPTYRSEGKYWLKLERLIEAYRRQDPPPQHKLAVPVSLINHLHGLGSASKSDKVQAICDMTSTAFYILLRVGEYTSHRKQDRRRTKQFRTCDITFYDAQQQIIPNTSTLNTLYSATRAVMRITNQKNGTRGSRISHDRQVKNQGLPRTSPCSPCALHPFSHSVLSHHRHH
jgi:hypothetical protein